MTVFNKMIQSLVLSRDVQSYLVAYALVKNKEELLAWHYHCGMESLELGEYSTDRQFTLDVGRILHEDLLCLCRKVDSQWEDRSASEYLSRVLKRTKDESANNKPTRY